MLGLEKLEQGAKDVEDMKVVLAEEDKKLAVASEETNKMLDGLQISSAEAQREGDKVAKDKAACEADAERIGKEKALAEIDLAKAQPFVDKANKAIASPGRGVLNRSFVEFESLEGVDGVVARRRRRDATSRRHQAQGHPGDQGQQEPHGHHQDDF